MLVKELLIGQPIVCLIDDYLNNTARLLAENDLVCLPVVESLGHKNLVGVVTDREICRQAVAAGLEPSKTRVGRVMSCRFLTVDSETGVEDCYRIMDENNLEYIFVTDENKSCLGVITKEDLSEANVGFHNRFPAVHQIKNDRIF